MRRWVGIRLVAAAVLLLGQGCGLTLLSEDREVAMGLEAYPKMLAEYPEIRRGPDRAMLQRVMHRLIPYADQDVRRVFRKPFQWEVRLLDAPKVVNAWALPGGKIAFYSGILPLAKDEAGIAAVMSHEIGHAVKRHGNQRISENILLGSLLSATAATLDSSSPEARDRNELILGALGVGGRYLVQLPYSRSHESEADAYGVGLMIRAGYDPWAAVRLWQRMGARAAGPPQFLSTHPSPGNRAKTLAELIPVLQAKYGKPQTKLSG